MTHHSHNVASTAGLHLKNACLISVLLNILQCTSLFLMSNQRNIINQDYNDYWMIRVLKNRYITCTCVSCSTRDFVKSQSLTAFSHILNAFATKFVIITIL